MTLLFFFEMLQSIWW